MSSDTKDFTVIKGYERRELIGRGGFGAVYRAYQPLLEREVAIKIILPEFANHPNFIRRFETEAQLIAQLEHIHIVPLYDYWREPDGAYLVMRWLRGGSLQDAIEKRGAWSISAIARLLDQIASALATAHRHGIIHRDLKPPNILLDEEDNAYLADFGIAKNLITGQQTVADDERFGSPAYISPEQVTGQPVSPQSDIYSLGVVLYMLLTGQTPFLDPSTTTVIRRHVTEPLPPLQMVRADLPHAINTVIWRATSKQPEARYPDALSLAADFRRVVASELGMSGVVHSAPTSTPRTIAPSTPGKTLIVDLPVAPKNPYKGLRPFQESDSGEFFGRKTLVEQLVRRLDGSHFLAVIGPSGSGKSSVVKAGLIPLLRRGALSGSQEWFIAQMVPGSQPFVEMEAALLSIAVDRPESLVEELRANDWGLLRVIDKIAPVEGAEILLVIDQFEEVFTQVEDEAERARFLNGIYKAVSDPDSRLRVIVTLRADLYDRPLLYPEFGGLIREHTEIVLPLSSSEMEEAIVGPAQWLGFRFEAGLISAIIADIHQQPGALPLLQFALTELFERRDGSTLTLAAYRASGGVLGALAHRADELYEGLDEASQSAARQLFLRMVTPGEGVDDMRRRVLREELNHIAGDKQTMRNVVDAFGKYRLLTFDHEPVTRAPTVEVAHEALIRVWGRLRTWLDANRDDLRIHWRLAASTAEWMNTNRDVSFLASGSRLTQFEALVASKTVALSEDELIYLQASTTAKQRATNRLRMFVAGLAVFSIVALGLALFAFDRQTAAVQEQNRANLEASISRSRELAALTSVSKPDLALLLSLEALKSADTFEARNSLLTTLQSEPYLLAYLHGNSGGVRSLAYSPDGSILASGGRDIKLWDVNGRRPLGDSLVGHTGSVNSLAFSPNGNILASGSNDGDVRLWDVETGQSMGQPFTGQSEAVWSTAFSPDGRMVASGYADGRIILWDVETGESVGAALEGHEDIVYSLAFSPDGRILASGSGDNTVRLWEVATGKLLGDPLEGHSNWVLSIAFSPDGALLASTGADRSIILWDVQSRELLGQIPTGQQDWVRSLAFSPDGRLLATGSADRSVQLWDIGEGEPIGEAFRGHSDAVWSVKFSPDGQTLASAGADGEIALWDTTLKPLLGRALIGHTDAILGLAFSPDGTHLASAGGNLLGSGQDNTIKLWNVAEGTEERVLSGHEQSVTSIAFSPDGKTIASGSTDQTIRLWDAASGETIRTMTNPNRGDYIAVAFSPDGKLLASGSDDGIIILWDIVSGVPSGEPLIGHTDRVLSLTFSPDGKTLASGSEDDLVIVWDVVSRKALTEALGEHDDDVSSVAFSPDGKILAAGSHDDTIILWDVITGQTVGQPLTGHSDWVLGIAFSPNGQLLVSGSADGSLILWDLAAGRRLGQPLIGHSDRVTATAFSPDGQTIASGSIDQTIVLWNVSLTAWEDRACRVANRNLSSLEWGQYFRDELYRETCPM